MSIKSQVLVKPSHRRAVDYMIRELNRHGINAEEGRSIGNYDLLIWVKPEKPYFLKIHAGDGIHFKLRKRLAKIENLLLAYIWDFEEAPSCLFMTYKEALTVLGSGPLETKSWNVFGMYSWSSATGLPKKRRLRMENRFKERWHWLISALSKS